MVPQIIAPDSMLVMAAAPTQALALQRRCLSLSPPSAVAVKASVATGHHVALGTIGAVPSLCGMRVAYRPSVAPSQIDHVHCCCQSRKGNVPWKVQHEFASAYSDAHHGSYGYQHAACRQRPAPFTLEAQHTTWEHDSLHHGQAERYCSDDRLGCQ